MKPLTFIEHAENCPRCQAAREPHIKLCSVGERLLDEMVNRLAPLPKPPAKA